MPTLKNRTCVFAGATGDISRKAVELLLKGGMNVVLMTHNPQTANEIINEYADLEGRCIAISNQKERKEIFRDISERFGSIDVFISKTGQLEKPVDLEEVSAEDLNKTFTHQVCDVFEGIKDALPYLKKSQNGRIILFSNIGSLNGFPQENIVDNIVRASVNSMVLSLSRQFAKDGITVNAVCFSGLIQDHAGKGLDAGDYIDYIPLKRIGTSQDLGVLIEYLASEESGFMTGEIIRLSGGLGIGL